MLMATEGWVTVNDSSENVKGSLFITASGGTVSTCTNFKVHTFTGPGTFCVSSSHRSTKYCRLFSCCWWWRWWWNSFREVAEVLVVIEKVEINRLIISQLRL